MRIDPRIGSHPPSAGRAMSVDPRIGSHPPSARLGHVERTNLRIAADPFDANMSPNA
jgi:hypothetical protein